MFVSKIKPAVDHSYLYSEEGGGSHYIIDRRYEERSPEKGSTLILWYWSWKYMVLCANVRGGS